VRPERILRAGGHRLVLGGGRPLLMGIVNATGDSFSDAGEHPTLAGRVRHAAELLEAGADLIDVGGESAFGGRPPVPPEEELARVVPLVRRLSGDLGAIVSIDTYKPRVAEAALDAGAVIVNDVSGLRDPRLADVCAAAGAGLVVMHTRVAPLGTLLEPGYYDDVVADVHDFLAERIAVARRRGVPEEALIVDPGTDFAKTPAQTVAVLRRLDVLHDLGQRRQGRRGLPRRAGGATRRTRARAGRGPHPGSVPGVLLARLKAVR